MSDGPAQPALPPEGSLHSAKPLELTVSPGTGREVWGQGGVWNSERSPFYSDACHPLAIVGQKKPQTHWSEIFMTQTEGQRPRKKGAPWALAQAGELGPDPGWGSLLSP